MEHHEGITPEIRSWVSGQLSNWWPTAETPSAAIQRLLEVNQTRKEVFVYRIQDCLPSLLPKPALFGNTELSLNKHPLVARALIYQEFIKSVLAIHPIQGVWYAGIDVCDTPVQTQKCPMLVFQKPVGAGGVLFPDVELLENNFYEDLVYVDDKPTPRKQSSAIFAGATTGGGLIQLEHLTTAAFPRLRSAKYFKGSDSVVFTLPRIVQCADASVEARIRELGLGSKLFTWSEQFDFKFLISIDGNGAACSRVAVALKSNSIILKYQSPNLLYYFSSLIPWQHFVPISNDDEIIRVINNEKTFPGSLDYIADESKLFALKHLNRSAVSTYAYLILKGLSLYFKA